MTWRHAARAIVLGVAAALAVVHAGQAQPDQPRVVGLWLTEDHKGIIAFQRCNGNEICGRLVWFDPSPDDIENPPVDEHNPTPALRGRPICGLPMLGSFKPSGEREWDGGWIYNPESGKTYHARMTLADDGTLHLRGYVGIPLFGETQVWTRADPETPLCTP